MPSFISCSFISFQIRMRWNFWSARNHSEILSTPAKKKVKKKGLDIFHTRTHWSKKFLFGNRSVNIPALELRLDWFEISVCRFLSDKKARLLFYFATVSGYFIQQGRLSWSRRHSLWQVDRKTVYISGDQLQGIDHRFNSLFLLFI